MKVGREEWLDSLKGFAILLVILGHVVSGYIDGNYFPEMYWKFYWLRSWIYSFHMPLFFLVSGFTFTLAYVKGGTLRKNAFLRQMFSLFWLYTLFALVQWVVKQVAYDWVNTAYTEEMLLRMYIEPLGNFWYLYVMFVFYALGALTRFYNKSPIWLLLLGAVSIVVVDAGLDDSNLTLYRICYHGVFFFLGSVLCRHREILRSKNLMGLCTMFLLSNAVFYYVAYMRFWLPNWKLFIAAATCFFNLALFYRWEALGRLRLFRICGKYCLELYLLHTFFTAGLRGVLPLLGVETPWLSVAVNFLLSTTICLTLSFLVSKAPCCDLIFHPVRFFDRVNRRRIENHD